MIRAVIAARAHLRDERVRLEQQRQGLADTTWSKSQYWGLSMSSSVHKPAAPRTTALTMVCVRVCVEEMVREEGEDEGTWRMGGGS